MNSFPPAAEPSWRDRNTLPYRLLIWFMLAAMATVLMAVVTYRASEDRTQAVKQMNMSVKAIDLTQLVLLSLRDGETAQRGYLLTNDPRHLEPYLATVDRVQQTFDGLNALEWPPAQAEQLQQLQALSQQKMAEIAETIALQRDGKRNEAMAVVNTDVGRMTMKAIRALVYDMLEAERTEWERRRQVWEEASRFSTNATWLGALVLLVLILVSAVMNARDYRIKMQQSWIKSGLMGLSARLQGDLRLNDLGQGALDYLARFMDAKVGTAYTVNDALELQRFGRYAVAEGDVPTRIAPGQGLTGQVAQSRTSKI